MQISQNFQNDFRSAFSRNTLGLKKNSSNNKLKTHSKSSVTTASIKFTWNILPENWPTVTAQQHNGWCFSEGIRQHPAPFSESNDSKQNLLRSACVVLRQRSCRNSFFNIVERFPARNRQYNLVKLAQASES